MAAAKGVRRRSIAAAQALGLSVLEDDKPRAAEVPVWSSVRQERQDRMAAAQQAVEASNTPMNKS